MGTVVIRSKKGSGLWDRIIPEAFWPDGAVSAHREHNHEPWQFTTKADIRRAKIVCMKQNLYSKREYRVTHKRCLYVWVFFCPGISGVFYRGWYTYLIGAPQGRDSEIYFDSDICKRLMELFPLYDASLFGHVERFPEEWMIRFAKCYQRGRWGGKPQGKAAVWAEVCGGWVTKILGRVEWPSKQRKAGGDG